MFFFLAFAANFLAYVYSKGCPNYDSNTWVTAIPSNCYIENAYSANLTNNDYCFDSSTHVLQAHVSLADPNVPRQATSVGDIQDGLKNCAMNDAHIVYCQSHCLNKTIENALVKASKETHGQDIDLFYSALEEMKAIGKGDWPLLAVTPFENHSEIDFQYYDDWNYCSMDILYVMPGGDYYPSWPFRTFYLTHKTTPIQ